ncbi:hypothetical protein BD309DRAFT_956925 [Dichomitus squalens]|uniref:Uncharacterized protein n=1 Tax=Dichomitus squalens TaxID=114155 RepID=A0A4V2K4N0_9APHY|nr:hypothetical protein BD309DRAFT_956925 [Dichomitus squalens]TBU63880.1 hypothetical protein BD310DRAFT_916103 [Dichomitus squalens]
MSAAPLPGVRRIVTGHSVDGVAVAKIDGVVDWHEVGPKMPGVRVGSMWKTGALPVKDNNDETDGATRTPDGDFGMIMKSGTNLQYTDLAPGASAPMHRTSSLDHNILLSGKLILIMEDGSETLLEKPGDTVVQRGTIHAWRNPGPEWTRWITIIIDAEPAVVHGRPLPAELKH